VPTPDLDLNAQVSMTATHSAHWANTKEVGVAWGIRGLVVIYKILGRTVLFITLYPVAAYFFLTNRAARTASHEYLHNLSEFAPDTAIRATRATTFRHFVSFAKSIGNRLAAWTGQITLDDVTYTGRDALVDLLASGKGAVLITAHLGSIEVCRAMARLRNDIRLNVLVHTAHAQMFNRVMQSVSPDQHVELIEVAEIDPSLAIRLKQKIAAGELIVIAGDRIPVSGNRFTVASFLGRPARFPQGPFILASLLRCPVYSLICLAEGQGFHVFLERFCDRVLLTRGTREMDLQRYVAQFAQHLEAYCQRAPLQWFNFYRFWHGA